MSVFQKNGFLKISILSILILCSACSTGSRVRSLNRLDDFSKRVVPEKRSPAVNRNPAVLHLHPDAEESIDRWVHYFTERDPERFERFLERGTQYETIVKHILRSHNVPEDFYYLAMIESGYQIHAKSRAKAVGPWQFMKGTGKHYGLKQTPELDERRDIIRSTEAAARYLKALHTVFQSWELALAAYNSGEGRVMGAVMRSRTRDFWVLTEKKALPPETRNYVPKWIAAKRIGENPQQYGIKISRSTNPFPAVAQVEIPGGVSFAQISRRSGLSLEWVRFLNPHLVKGRTPLLMKKYPIWVPQTHETRFASISWLIEQPEKQNKKSGLSRKIAQISRSTKDPQRKSSTRRIQVAGR